MKFSVWAFSDWLVKSFYTSQLVNMHITEENVETKNQEWSRICETCETFKPVIRCSADGFDVIRDVTFFPRSSEYWNRKNHKKKKKKKKCIGVLLGSPILQVKELIEIVVKK